MIPIYKPYLTKRNLQHAHKALDSTWISSQGKYIEATQELLKDFLKVNYVLLTNSGTSAFHLVARVVSEIYPEKRNVITGNNHYVAAWNAWEYENTFNLSPVDANINTWNMDFEKLPDDHWATVISVVHNLGNVVDVPALQLKYPKSLIVEDSCEAFGGLYGKGYYAGTKSFASAFSFYGNKSITSGEGGAFVTNSEDAFFIARRLWGQGQSDQKFIHSELGYNYRMTNIQAAILYGQLKSLDIITNLKMKIDLKYRSSLEGIVEFQSWEPYTTHSLWMTGIRIPGSNYEEAKKFFNSKGIETRPMFYPITRHEHYRNVKSITEIAEKLNIECIILPSYPELTLKEQNHIIETVKAYVSRT
jgi:perosamine synthetase